MEDECQIDLLSQEELLSRLEGGLFSLFASEEQYVDLIKIAAALGVKNFVEQKMHGYDRAELLQMFSDGEGVISLFLQYAAEKDLLEVDGTKEEE